MPAKINPAVFSICLIFIIFGVVNCADGKIFSQKGEITIGSKKIEEVIKKHSMELMSIPGVVGIASGIFNGKPCINLYVFKKTEDLEKKITDTLDGYPVKIEETGELRAIPKNKC